MHWAAWCVYIFVALPKNKRRVGTEKVRQPLENQACMMFDIVQMVGHLVLGVELMRVQDVRS